MSLETNPPSDDTTDAPPQMDAPPEVVEAAGLNEAGVQHVESLPIEVSGELVVESVHVSTEDGSLTPQFTTPRDLLAEQEADDAPIVPHRTLVIPVVPDATGFGSSSFGLNLSPTAAQGLINLVAGLGRAGVKFHDASGAIGWVLEQLA